MKAPTSCIIFYQSLGSWVVSPVEARFSLFDYTELGFYQEPPKELTNLCRTLPKHSHIWRRIISKIKRITGPASPFKL